MGSTTIGDVWMDRAVETKARILSAARAEFAEFGIAGARVDRIAEAAHINKQRIYAYFGDKNQLFEAVLADAFSRLADAIPLPQSRDELIEYAGRVFDFHQENVDFNRLLAWEALAFRDGALPVEAERHNYYADKVKSVAEAFPGLGEDVVAPLLLQIIGLAAWPVLMSPLQRHLYGLEPGSLPPAATTRSFVVRAAAALVNEILP